VDEVLGLARGVHDGLQVAVLLDRETGDRLARLGDAVDDLAGPARLDADHHHRGDIGVRARSDHGAEMQVEVLAELQPAVGVRQRDRALDVVGDGLAAALEMSSTGRITTWLRTPTRPFSRRYAMTLRSPFDVDILPTSALS
jgi:hypothetical protein